MANSEIAGKLYDMLKIKLGRESHTHTEIINEAILSSKTMDFNEHISVSGNLQS